MFRRLWTGLRRDSKRPQAPALAAALTTNAGAPAPRNPNFHEMVVRCGSSATYIGVWTTPGQPHAESTPTARSRIA